MYRDWHAVGPQLCLHNEWVKECSRWHFFTYTLGQKCRARYVLLGTKLCNAISMILVIVQSTRDDKEGKEQGQSKEQRGISTEIIQWIIKIWIRKELCYNIAFQMSIIVWWVTTVLRVLTQWVTVVTWNSNGPYTRDGQPMTSVSQLRLEVAPQSEFYSWTTIPGYLSDPSHQPIYYIRFGTWEWFNGEWTCD